MYVQWCMLLLYCSIKKEVTTTIGVFYRNYLCQNPQCYITCHLCLCCRTVLVQMTLFLYNFTPTYSLHSCTAYWSNYIAMCWVKMFLLTSFWYWFVVQWSKRNQNTDTTCIHFLYKWFLLNSIRTTKMEIFFSIATGGILFTIFVCVQVIISS